MTEKSSNAFWKETRKIKCSKTPLPTSIEGASGNDEILKLWRKHYSELFNCLKETSRTNKYNNIEVRYSDSMLVSPDNISDAINKLDDNKACRLDYAEHLTQCQCKGFNLALHLLYVLSYSWVLARQSYFSDISSDTRSDTIKSTHIFLHFSGSNISFCYA